jgi:hypothetical protein
MISPRGNATRENCANCSGATFSEELDGKKESGGARGSSAPYHIAAPWLDRDDRHDEEGDRIHDDQLAVEDEA